MKCETPGESRDVGGGLEGREGKKREGIRIKELLQSQEV